MVVHRHRVFIISIIALIFHLACMIASSAAREQRLTISIIYLYNTARWPWDASDFGESVDVMLLLCAIVHPMNQEINTCKKHFRHMQKKWRARINIFKKSAPQQPKYVCMRHTHYINMKLEKKIKGERETETQGNATQWEQYNRNTWLLLKRIVYKFSAFFVRFSVFRWNFRRT